MAHQEVQATAPLKWIVVATHPHREAFAIENLERQDYEAYCPMILKRTRHARRTYDVRRPLFPSYIFLSMTSGDWHPVLGTYGVRTVLRNGDRPAILPPGFVENLRACEIAGVICKPEERLKPGQVVTINGGQLDGLIGRIIQIRDRDRVLLLLDMLNQKAKVHVDARMLTPCERNYARKLVKG
jgi:transcriptional antiterminator RfaH